MGRAFDSITDQMRTFIERQHLFFVATAPSHGGRVNLSPKGYDSFRVMDDRRVAYLDLTGSGAETIAHVRDNGRITFMFCAFDGKPNIVRLYGHGTVLRPGHDGWGEAIAIFDGSPALDGAVRSVIVADIDRTSNSCGYAVPFMEFTADRDRLIEWADDKDDEAVQTYWATKNARSIDGLPALD
jgi:Pyridoxamine 5'-phosphate oxidase